MKALRSIGLVLAAGLFVATGTGCGAHGDAKNVDPSNIKDGTNSHAIRFPDGFRNVAFSCFDREGVYVTSAGSGDTLPSAIYVVVDDPHCMNQ